MRKWRLPLTYKPKVEPVLLGTCRQTIRTGRKKQEGDLIRFFVWSEKPYRSKQIDLTAYEPIWMAEDIYIVKEGFLFFHNGKFYKEVHWHEWEMKDLAKKDGIVPPTGETLRDVLTKYNKIPPEGIEAQILRW